LLRKRQALKSIQMADWNPELYNRFRRYRAEPVEHILSRLEIAADERMIDLGCGPGLRRREFHGGHD